jgi:MFS family permease
MRKLSDNHQLVVLFTGNLIILFIGMGLFPVLPHYIIGLGTNQGMVGVYFAAIYSALTVGNLLAGGLSAKVDRRKIFIAAGIVGVPALLGLAFASNLWQALILTALVWFCGGIDLALINVFMGQQTTKQNRGKSFSLISLSIPLASLIGASTVAFLSVNYGYKTMFTSLAGVWMMLPILGYVAIKDHPFTKEKATTGQLSYIFRKERVQFRLLLMAAVLSATVINMERLGLSLTMRSLGYPAEAIAATTTISGIFALPVMLFAGSLSDRFGNKLMLRGVYLAVLLGAILLSQANSLWQFTLVAVLMLIAFCLNGAMTSALAANLARSRSADGKLAWINTAISAGAILSFVSTGYVLDLVGANYMFLVASVFPVVAALILQSATPRVSLPEPFPGVPEADCP